MRICCKAFKYFCSSPLLPLLCCCCGHKSHEMTVLNHLVLNYTTISKEKGLTKSKCLRHSVRMSLGVCPGPSPKFWRLVGCFKFRSLGAKTTLRSVAFQPCIWMGGVNIVKIGEKHDFVQILGLKTPISVDRNFEHLTSEGSVTRNFEISSSLTPSLQNMDIDGPN